MKSNHKMVNKLETKQGVCSFEKQHQQNGIKKIFSSCNVEECKTLVRGEYKNPNKSRKARIYAIDNITKQIKGEHSYQTQMMTISSHLINYCPTSSTNLQAQELLPIKIMFTQSKASKSKTRRLFSPRETANTSICSKLKTSFLIKTQVNYYSTEITSSTMENPHFGWIYYDCFQN